MQKTASLLIAMLLVLPTLTFPVSASDLPKTPDSSLGSSIITPYYTAITTANAYITMSGSTATCEAAIKTSGYRTHVTLYIQKSTNGGSTYSDVAVLSDNDYYSSLVTVSASKSSLDASSKYRTKAIVKVYNTSGSLLDSTTLYSSGK